MKRLLLLISALGLASGGCFSDEAQGIARAPEAETTVKMDFFKRPLPEIPLPNDIATRVDHTSATGLRINASMVAPTGWERLTRELIDNMNGWGIFQPIAIPFTGALNVESILAGHQDIDYDMSNDVIYVIDVDKDSEHYGTAYPLDIGNGNYPVVMEDLDVYGKNDPRGQNISLLFEEADEDLNGNGVLDPGEDTDADGVLDRPNYLPGHTPAWDDLAARADALMYFYERQSHTLIVRTLEPLREETTYAVVVTRRILDADGQPVGSPFKWINHTSQTEALEPLYDVLPSGLALDDVAFAFTFTTQSVTRDIVAVRDGIYGYGTQAHLAEEFPAKVASLRVMRDAEVIEGLKRPYILPGETWAETLRTIRATLQGQDEESEQEKTLAKAIGYVDYISIGSFMSPQLFNREDENGDRLPYNAQSWPADLDRVKAEARELEVMFNVVVPRKEVSARGEGKPAPVVVMGHGHKSNRFSEMVTGQFLAKMGLAVIVIDGPSHGLSLSEQEVSLARNLFQSVGLGPAGEAFLQDRAVDVNQDGRKDSGYDFWTSNLFHTRDMLRQYALDQMQLMRLVRSFDGKRTWDYDVNGDGQPDLAGDFDGDGAIDIGGDAEIYMLGGSLGGIISMLVSAIEPEVTAALPLVGGGGIADIGFRSHNGTLPAGLIVSGITGPIYAGTIDADSGEMVIEASTADVLALKEYELGRVQGIEVGDVMVAENLVNGELGCGYVLDSGRVRAAVESDKGDATRILFYRGVNVVEGTKCELDGTATPIAELTNFESEFTYYGRVYEPGEPLEAIGFGLGRHRGSPDMRKTQMLGQMVLDGADPASFARYLMKEKLTYATGQETGAHMLSVPTLGDMNVPVSTAISHGRAAGYVEYLEADRRYGKPDNQVLIDTYTVEGVDKIKRYTAPDGSGVHLDIENFSKGKDVWEGLVPRMEEPLRMGLSSTDPHGGVSALIVPLTSLRGKHGFDSPGVPTDRSRNDCRAGCEVEGTCGCDDIQEFDVGMFLMNMGGEYFKSGGKAIRTDECMAYDNCASFPELPVVRSEAELL